MPRTKAQFEEMRQATRSKIQGAASHLFARKGVAGTNVQEIADRAGISIGLLYKHYKTKDELFDELVDMARTGLAETTRLLSSDGDPREILTAITTEIIDDYRKDDEFTDYLIFLTQALISGLESEALTGLVQEDKRLIGALAGLIERGQGGGAIRGGNPGELAFAYMSAIQGIGVFRNVMQSDFTVPSVEIMLSFLLSGR